MKLYRIMGFIFKYLVWIFFPLSLIHYFLILLRNKLYDFNILNTQRLTVPVISVGNIQLGGTGKTPLIIELIEKIQNSGLTIGILSRGYKRKNNEEIVLDLQNEEINNRDYTLIGDEPAIILEYLKKGAIGIGANRYRVGLKLLNKASPDIILLDDGFQHRKLYRDFDICMINVSKWQKYPFLYPFSYLRDTKSSLKRANAIILTKFGSNYQLVEEIKTNLESTYKKPIFLAGFSIDGLVKIPEQTINELSEIKNKKVAAFSGIADSNDFFNLLKTEGINVVYSKEFPDHYNYTINDLKKINHDSSKNGADILITTEKDEVKIKSLIEQQQKAYLDIYFIKVRFEIENEKRFIDLIEKRIDLFKNKVS